MKRSIIKKSFISTLPVMAGYIFLGIGFGIIMKAHGYGAFWSFLMSAFIYAGAMQYLAIELISGGVSFAAIAITTLLVNARHLFYGLSVIDKYKNTGIAKPYLVFSLSDETYSLVCSDTGDIGENEIKSYYFLVSLFNHIYWITGSLIGAVAGNFIKFSTEGIDFALTALFITIVTDNWLKSKNHTPAVIGILSSVICLFVFGQENFLIPAMLLITLSLVLTKPHKKEGGLY